MTPATSSISWRPWHGPLPPRRRRLAQAAVFVFLDPIRETRGQDWPLQTPANRSARALRGGLYGRAGGARSPPSRPQSHQVGHGHKERHCPVRGGAPGAGLDGPSEHREGPWSGRHRHRPALFRHGTGARHQDYRFTATKTTSARRRGWDCLSKSAMRFSTPTRRESFIATSKPSNILVTVNDGVAVPKVMILASPKHSGTVDRPHTLYGFRAIPRHARLHESRASRDDLPGH